MQGQNSGLPWPPLQIRDMNFMNARMLCKIDLSPSFSLPQFADSPAKLGADVGCHEAMVGVLLTINSMPVEGLVDRPGGSAGETADEQIKATKASDQELEQILTDVMKRHQIPAPDHVSWASKRELAERESRWTGQVTNLKAEEEIIPPVRTNNVSDEDIEKSYSKPTAAASGMS